MSNKTNNLTTKRFVIRKSLIGKHTIITFVNKKQETVQYNHDEVYTLDNVYESEYGQLFDELNMSIEIM